MTDHTQARAEGRAEGIRECLDIAIEALTGDADGRDIYTAILALLDNTPSATQPAQVSVAEAVDAALLAIDEKIDLWTQDDDLHEWAQPAKLIRADVSAALRAISESRT
jgi:hypothetical protein